MTYWIIDNFLGTCSLSEMPPKGVIIVDVRDLNDGWNDPVLIREKVKVILKCLNTGKPIVVRCQAGLSRSNALAVSALCKLNGKYWNENETLVRRMVTRTQINSSLRNCCKKALKND